MSAGITAVDNSASPAAGLPGNDNPSQESGADVQPEFVKVEDYKAMQDRLQNLSATIGTLNNKINGFEKRVTQSAPPAADKDQQPVRQDDALDMRLKELEAQNQIMKEQARNQSLFKAFSSLGVVGNDIEDASILFAAKHPDSLVTNQRGEIVSVGDTSLESYVNVWLSGAGKKFLPSKANPSTNGTPNGLAGAPGIPTITRAEFRAPTLEMQQAVAEGKLKIVG